MTTPPPSSRAVSVDVDETPEDNGARTEEVLRAFHEEVTLGKAYDSRLIAKLWPFVKPHQRLLWWAFAVLLITAAGGLVRPLIMREAIDQGVLKHDSGVLMRGGFLLAGVVLAVQILNFIQIYTMQIVGARAMADLRRHVFSFLHSLRLGFFDNQPVGRLVTRVTNDVDAVLELFASGALNAFGDLVKLVGIVILMLVMDWKLSLIAFAATPPVALLVVLVRRRSRDAFREIRAKTARMNANMNEQVSGMSVVQAYGHEEGAAREFDEINMAYREANIRSIKYEATQDAAIETVAAVCLASIVVSLGYRPVSFGTVVAFNAYLVQFFEPISALAQRYTLLQSAMAGAERIFGLLEEEAPDAPPKRDGSRGGRQRHGVRARRRELRVQAERAGAAARRASARAVARRSRWSGPPAPARRRSPGCSCGCTTRSRAWCASMVKTCGGLERTDLRRRFAVVPQDVFLFPGTVATNIAASATPDRERVEEALRRIGALDLFESRQGGIDAPIEEHGGNFSAGERQLIAFARALYRDAPISDPRRGDGERRQRDRSALAARARGADARAHFARHRAPAEHHPQGRPHRGVPQGTHRRAGPPRGAARAGRSVRASLRAAVCSPRIARCAAASRADSRGARERQPQQRLATVSSRGPAGSCPRPSRLS